MPLDDRSAAARLLAEEALVILHDGLGETPLRLIVVGGLVPETLAAADTPAHLGTTDIDILIAVHVRDVADAAPVERALTAIGAIPDPVQPDGWQWRIPVGSVRVRIDFLCDDDSLRNQEAVLLPGCSQLAAFNLRGTGYVARDHWQREITVADRTVQVSFAGLEGYLLAKAHAARQRGQDKDYYDLAYVLLHNHAGGPAQAAERLRPACSPRRSLGFVRFGWSWARVSTTPEASARRRTPARRCWLIRSRLRRRSETTRSPPSPNSSAPSTSSKPSRLVPRYRPQPASRRAERPPARQRSSASAT
jgi:hypothetical protein